MANNANAIPHPGWIKVFVRLMKLRVIVLLQITAICAILVHDLLARHDLIDIDRSWGDTLSASSDNCSWWNSVRWWLKCH